MDVIAQLGVGGLLAVTIFAAAGSAVQAATGFGLALLIVPFLALLDPGFVPGPLLAAGIICSASAAWRDRSAIDGRQLAIAVGAAFVGAVVGVAALKASGGRDHSKLFGGLVLLAVAISLSGFAVRTTPRALATGGAAGGLMGAMVGIHGPPMAIVLQREPAAKVRAMLGAFFTVVYALTVLLLAAFGLFGRAETIRTVLLVPGMILGLGLAPLLIEKIDRGLIRWIILLLSGMSGALLLTR